MTNRTFYKTVIKVVVISEHPISEDMDLKDIQHEVTFGDSSGQLIWDKPIKLNGKQAAKELMLQGTDPEFFQITEEGDNIESS